MGKLNFVCKSIQSSGNNEEKIYWVKNLNVMLYYHKLHHNGWRYLQNSIVHKLQLSANSWKNWIFVCKSIQSSRIDAERKIYRVKILMWCYIAISCIIMDGSTYKIQFFHKLPLNINAWKNWISSISQFSPLELM